MGKTLLRNWKLSLACISSLINYDLVTPFLFFLSPKLVLAFFHQQHPCGACEILSCSGVFHVVQAQCAVLWIVLPGSPVAQPRCIKHSDWTVQWEHFVVGSFSWRWENTDWIKILFSRLKGNLMLTDDCSPSIQPVLLIPFDFSWVILLVIQHTIKCSGGC